MFMVNGVKQQELFYVADKIVLETITLAEAADISPCFISCFVFVSFFFLRIFILFQLQCQHFEYVLVSPNFERKYKIE